MRHGRDQSWQCCCPACEQMGPEKHLWLPRVRRRDIALICRVCIGPRGRKRRCRSASGWSPPSAGIWRLLLDILYRHITAVSNDMQCSQPKTLTLQSPCLPRTQWCCTVRAHILMGSLCIRRTYTSRVYRWAPVRVRLQGLWTATGLHASALQ